VCVCVINPELYEPVDKRIMRTERWILGGLPDVSPFISIPPSPL
jgi:hypothetical protein